MLFENDIISIAIVAYLVVINIIGFVLPPIDKKKAQSGEWRIPEKTLFIVSFLGGAAAMLISMKLFRHKTKHKRFMIGIPLIILLHIAIIIVVIVI